MRQVGINLDFCELPPLFIICPSKYKLCAANNLWTPQTPHLGSMTQLITGHTQRHNQRHKHTQTETHRDTNTQRYNGIHRHADKKTQTQSKTQTHRQTNTINITDNCIHKEMPRQIYYRCIHIFIFIFIFYIVFELYLY